MCGIVGAVDLLGERTFPRAELDAMARALVHRGPDDGHAHLEPGLAMATRRLAIVDVAGGRQPVCNEAGDVWASVNGELFDYPDLARRLTDRGHTLATRCDSEAWVHLYEDHGEGVFERARGQFAVALWDARRRRLLLGRDRVGICPLYYARHEGWLLWASEIKGLLAGRRIVAAADPRGVDHVLSFFAAGTTRTCFEGVRSIPPGHFLDIAGGSVSLRPYWDLDFPDDGHERRSHDVDGLVDELHALLRRAVTRRLRGDVPVVAYLSGGVDSSLVLALAAEAQGKGFPAFTVGFDSGGSDERALARDTARDLGSPLTTVAVDRGAIAGAFPALVLAAEGPVIDTADACLLLLAERVHAAGYKVALCGEGADEAAAGYPWYKTEQSLDALGRRVGPWAPAAIRRAAFGLVGGGSRRPPPRAIQGQRTAQQDLFDPLAQARAHVYSDTMWDRLDGHSPFEDLDTHNPRMARWHPLHRSLYVEYKLMLAGHLLVGKGDRVAMRASVETRYPYLDEEVVAFFASLAPAYKLRGGQDKWLLRRLAARVLPRATATRPKAMFKADPVFAARGGPAWVEELLSPDSLRATGYFDPWRIRRERMLQGVLPAWAPRRFVVDATLTGVIATQLWHHLYLGGGLCSLPAWSPA